MANLHIVSDNAADRATLSASSTSGVLAVTNLQTDKKSDVWRATGTSARLTATWTSQEPIQAVAMPFCDLSPTATMRVRLTNEVTMTNVLSAPNDFTAASWTKSNVAVSTGVSGPDGANSATTLAATAAGATVSASVSVTAGPFTSSIWMRRRTGAGAVSIRNAANSAWLPLTLSGSWARFANDGGATGTSALVNIQLGTSGDAIDVCFAQLEAGGVATSYYPGARPLGYIDSWQSYSYDSGAVLACPAPAIKLRGWTAAQSASAYAYGGGACARLWLPSSVQAYGMAVDIADANNLLGYIEAARLVAGSYWSPMYNTESLSETFVDAATHYRTDAGDLLTQASTIHKKIPLDFQYMPAADRAALANILRASRAYPIFLSVFPGNADLELERAHTVYGKRTSDSEVAVQAAINYGAKLEVESI